MDTQPSGGMIYTGEAGYVEVRAVSHDGKAGALLRYVNPDARKLHAVDVQGMKEMEEGVAAVLAAPGLEFCVFYGAYDPVHAGADITQFAGDPDIPAIKAHLDRGTVLDAKIKAEMWPRLRTVAILCGDRYGGSVEWPLFAQFAVASSNARLQFSEVHLGIVPGWNGVLNVLLRSNAANALYMGTTGNPVDAAGLKAAGIAQRVVETPAAPDRRATPPEDWPAVWTKHAEECQELLLAGALELATKPGLAYAPVSHTIADDAALRDELARRQDPAPYIALRDELAAKVAALGSGPIKDDLKALTKEALKSLAKLGKPLAPAAVSGLTEFVERWGKLSQADLQAQFAKPAQEEADLCTALMSTEHRRRGIDAILTRDVASKVPVFD